MPDLENIHAYIYGLLSQVIAFLLSLQWDPVTISLWKNPEGDTYELKIDEPFPVMIVVHDLLKTYHSIKAATNASLHYNGESLTRPIAWQTCLERNRYLKGKKRYQELAILETIQSGASWPIDRVHEAYPDTHNCCPLCQQPSNKWHTFWTCPSLEDSEDPDILESQHLKHILIDSMLNEEHIEEAFWLRGLLTQESISLDNNLDPLDIYPITMSCPHRGHSSGTKHITRCSSATKYLPKRISTKTSSPATRSTSTIPPTNHRAVSLL